MSIKSVITLFVIVFYDNSWIAIWMHSNGL